MRLEIEKRKRELMRGRVKERREGERGEKAEKRFILSFLATRESTFALPGLGTDARIAPQVR
jgi:hypothetical protein